MRVAIVADEGGEWKDLYLTQIRALVRRMRATEALSPVVVCPAGSLVENIAREEDVPCVIAASAGNLFRIFKLWQWQRRADKLEVLIVGESALGAGRGLLKLRGKRDCGVSFAFFMAPPQNDARNIRVLARGRKFFCGTGLIADQIGKMIGEEGLFQIVPPGIETESYSASRLEANSTFNSDHHFAFGMAGSLQPESGALLVIRAMSALWQKEGLPPWEARMFGGGPRCEEILREAANLGVLSRLCLLDEQPLSEASALCHAWLAPGTASDEAPQVLWAGVAAELPLVCSVSPLHMERLPADAPALRISENDPQKLAKAMIDVLASPESRAKMSRGMAEIKYLTSADYMAKTVCDALAGEAEEKDGGT